MEASDRSTSTSTGLRYVLITPAHNEADFIEETLRSVVHQTRLPERWVIVSDGSTDGTDEIVARYASEYPFITFIRREPGDNRNFASKVFAIRTGAATLDDVEYEYIGNLDADISFEPDYCDSVLSRIDADPQIGIGAGQLYEKGENGLRVRQLHADRAIPGAIQMFRRECYEAIGGYLPLRYGGIDAMAEARARMSGWKTQIFTDVPAIHHRVTGSASAGGALRHAYRQGMQEFVNGYHPLYEVMKSFRRTIFRPYVLGGLARLWGYISAWGRRLPREVPDDLAAYIRREQVQRLRGVISRSTRRT